MIINFQTLPVFIEAHQLTLEIYKLTKSYPREEIYGITSQIRRSASSVPANIVEGVYRGSKKELIKFLIISRASCWETQYHLLLSKDLEYINQQEYGRLIEKCDMVNKQLNGWINQTNKKIKSA